MTIEYLAECNAGDAVAVFVAPMPHDCVVEETEMVMQEPAETWTTPGTAVTGSSPLRFQCCLQNEMSGKIAAKAIVEWAPPNDEIVVPSSAIRF